MPDDTRRDAIEIRPAERQVWVNGKPAALGARAFDLLMALYGRRDRVVGKNELLDLVWPGLVVEENNLQVQVSSLRKLLGPNAIATIPGRGYRFTLPDEALAHRRAAPPPTSRATSDAPAAVSAADELPRGNLPASPPMVGRDEDFAAVATLLQRHPVVSIVGAGGIGKTRLALAVAQDCALETPEGRWWVELAPLADAAQVPSAIAGALGLQLPGGRPPAEALAAMLARYRALIVLDNCEHVADAAAGVIDCLRAQAPDVRLLVSSQELLKCVDEQAYRLASLALPDEGHAADPEAASRYGAVALFVARAHAADPRFALGADNVAAVIDICRRLDGIALAIELAAARVPMLGVQGLRARLDQMFNVLTGASRMRLRRHQTLRAALEWSHGLLTDDERAAFRRLGVFSGGFTLALAQGVAADERIDGWQVLDLLSQLIDKSLVLAEGEGEPRYRLLEPTRAYALEQLGAAGESAALLRRHAETMAAAMAAYDAGRWTQPMAERLRGLVELGNVRVALDWAMGPEGDRRLAVRLCAAGWEMWSGNNQSAEALARMLALWPLPPDLPPREQAEFCLALASLRGPPLRDEVLQAARRAVELFRALGDRGRLADALLRLGVIGAFRSDVPETDAAIAEAAALLEPGAPRRQRASLATALAQRALMQRRFAEAAEACRRQAALQREDGSRFGEYLALLNLAIVSLNTGEIDEAIDILRRAIAGLSRIRAPFGLGSARAYLTIARAVRGDADDGLAGAREAYETLVPNGATSLDKPLMAAAVFHARHGDLERAALIAGCAGGPNVRGAKPCCPIDERLQREVDTLVQAGADAARREAWQRAGAAMTPAQIAPIAFNGAPMATPAG
jgi:predicted ATPase/DNA-binding winged helix-turn-helix (wHTH) protein